MNETDDMPYEDDARFYDEKSEARRMAAAQFQSDEAEYGDS
jgi:hypothetical protein